MPSLAEIKENMMKTCIRHISLRLEARIKRADPEDYFRLPAPEKKGVHLKADVKFDDLDAGQGLPRTSKTYCVETELSIEEFRSKKKSI